MTFWVCIVIAATAVWFLSDVFHRLLSSRLADRVLKKKSDPKCKSAPRPPALHFIAISEDGFEIGCRKTPSQPLRMEWSRIAKVAVFKRDLFGYDLVCMAIEPLDGAVLEVDEEMDGWMPFIEILPDRLPGCKPWHDWFMRVTFPAFETNLETIFQCSPPTSEVSIAALS